MAPEFPTHETSIVATAPKLIARGNYPKGGFQKLVWALEMIEDSGFLQPK